MWASLIAKLAEISIPLAVSAIATYLERSKASKEAKKSFSEWLEKMQKSPSTPVKLKLSYAEQLRRLSNDGAGEATEGKS